MSSVCLFTSNDKRLQMYTGDQKLNKDIEGQIQVMVICQTEKKRNFIFYLSFLMGQMNMPMKKKGINSCQIFESGNREYLREI